jgi:predicted phage replisome organizer
MSDNKKFYWLKLKEDFFTQPQIKKLRKIAGGDTYTIIYQKIMLLSIKGGGLIQFQNIEKTLDEELALILDEDLDNIKMVISFMESTNLIEYDKDDNNNFFIPSVINLIGSHTDAAKRMKKMRERNHSNQNKVSIPQIQNIEFDINGVTCYAGVTPMLQDVTQKEEKREKKENIELEKDKKINIDIENIYKEWNLKNKTFLKGDKQVIKNLEIILKDYSYEDVVKVIDYMILDKKTYRDQGYLTLSTLSKPTTFGGKLERANNFKPQQITTHLLHRCNDNDYSEEF